MKMKNVLLALSLAVSVGQTVLAPSLALSQEACHVILGRADVQVTRAEMADQLKFRKIPAVMAKTREGTEIPVILMNSKTGPLMSDFLENSIGTQVAHQPDWHNDHGLFRLSKIVADMDAPGHRNRGELHRTGISWVGLDGYLQYGGGSKRVEIAYSLTKAEMKTATLYGLMRRAAIIRVRFAFGNFEQNANQPNFLNNGGENCFGFCQSSSVDYHISEMRNKFATTKLGTSEEVLARADVQEWLTGVRSELLKADINSAASLSPQISMRVPAPASIASTEAFKAMSSDQKMEALNWLVGLDISVPYRDLTRTLGFQNSGNGFSGMNNPRATAVLIYDSKVSPEVFVSKQYESRGIFSTWNNQNTNPIQ